MTDNVIIKVDNIKKEYRLGAIGGATLRGELQSLWARLRGKEDPNSKIGSKQYSGNEKFLALDGISFEVKAGERIGIIGHNGAGKSTFLKVLSRVTAPTSGTIYYNGRIASMLEVGTGFHPELTGRENVYMNGAILGMTKAEIDKKFDDIVAFAEMEKFIDTPVKRYSSGMYVKLAFAVAAHLDSEIMIMDEVLAVGDMKFQQKCLGKMDDVSKTQGRTILYVSHNMNTIRQLCTRCLVLNHGRLVFDGDVEDAISMYMGEIDVSNKTIDVSEKSRDKFVKDDAVHINKIEILNSESAIFNCGKNVELKIDYFAKKAMDDLCLRFPIFHADGRVIGMATTMPEIKCTEGDNSIKIKLDLQGLVSGKYSIRMVAYSTNSMGATQTHDVVDEAVIFQLAEDEQNSAVTWDQRYWGAIKFPEIEIL